MSVGKTSGGLFLILLLIGITGVAFYSCEQEKLTLAKQSEEQRIAEEQESLELLKKAAEQKARYLVEYHPQLKVVLEELRGQLQKNDENTSLLKNMLNMLAQEDGKQIIRDRLKILISQKAVVNDQILRIDNEAEKGMVLRVLNTIDGGGIAVESLKDLTIESAKLLKNAEATNEMVNRSYSTGVRVQTTDVPMKAEVVSLLYVGKDAPKREEPKSEDLREREPGPVIWPLGEPEKRVNPRIRLNDSHYYQEFIHNGTTDAFLLSACTSYPNAFDTVTKEGRFFIREYFRLRNQRSRVLSNPNWPMVLAEYACNSNAL